MANGRSSKKLSLNLRCFIDTLIHKSIYGTIYRVVHEKISPTNKIYMRCSHIRSLYP